MRSFDCLGDPVRRRILGLRIDDEWAADEAGTVVQSEMKISSPEVSADSTSGCSAATGSRPSAADA